MAPNTPNKLDPKTLTIPRPAQILTSDQAPSVLTQRCEGVVPPPPPAKSDVDGDGDKLSKPLIRVHPGQLHETVAQAEQVLADDGRYFHAVGPIVRIVERMGGGVLSEQVNDQTLTAVLSAKIDWERRGQSKEWTVCDPPANVVQNLLRGQDRPNLLPLLGLARQPFYGAERKLITKPGYDIGTGIYAVFNPADYDFTDLSRDKALKALTYLTWLLAEFPFANEGAKSAALAAMLTAAIRPSLAQAPAFNISATSSGSGKSYLASLIALMAGPGEPFNISYPTKAEEATKVVLAMLLEKPAVILFDDMQTDWRSFGALNKALTSPTTTERVLGSSTTATARTNVLFLGTGNNIEPQDDMRRRVVSIYLAPHCETPALRKFREESPLVHVQANRAGAVQAALTIIGAFQAAGEPMAAVPPIGTYEEWSKLCRHSLIWLGEPDPAQSLIEQVANDTHQKALEAFLAEWWTALKDQTITVRRLLEVAVGRPEFSDALCDLPVMEGRVVNPSKLGWYLRKNRGRKAGGLWIEAAECTERKGWRLGAD